MSENFSRVLRSKFHSWNSAPARAGTCAAGQQWPAGTSAWGALVPGARGGTHFPSTLWHFGQKRPLLRGCSLVPVCPLSSSRACFSFWYICKKGVETAPDWPRGLASSGPGVPSPRPGASHAAQGRPRSQCTGSTDVLPGGV